MIIQARRMILYMMICVELCHVGLCSAEELTPTLRKQKSLQRFKGQFHSMSFKKRYKIIENSLQYIIFVSCTLLNQIQQCQKPSHRNCGLALWIALLINTKKSYSGVGTIE